jgi:hypothetical protein
MCATCRGVLTALTQGGSETTWYHATGADHPAVPVPREDPVLVCDFCSAPAPEWYAECTPFLASADAVVQGLGLDNIDDGVWAACDLCASYIRRGDWPRLLYRAEKAYAWPPGADGMVAYMHDQFRHHHTGVITRRSA